MPIAISATPPNGSGRHFTTRRANAPITLPAKLIASDIAPMSATGNSSATKESKPVKANVTPTARASMLVATASRSTIFILDTSTCYSSSALKPSRIMLMPSIKSIANATQWS